MYKRRLIPKISKAHYCIHQTANHLSFFGFIHKYNSQTAQNSHTPHMHKITQTSHHQHTICWLFNLGAKQIGFKVNSKFLLSLNLNISYFLAENTFNRDVRGNFKRNFSLTSGDAGPYCRCYGTDKGCERGIAPYKVAPARQRVRQAIIFSQHISLFHGFVIFPPYRPSEGGGAAFHISSSTFPSYCCFPHSGDGIYV